ncbi:MAG: leucine-rich repeat domain-containing protein [Candidatus Hydrogenedentes bacterium]|nr:leucine-rich repeat domain-containing protein [Candidatus Hydrogenedentota bacterium]
MKARWIITFLFTFVMVSLLGGCCAFKGESILFPDQMLEKAIRTELGKPFFIICSEELKSITILNARNMGISNLKGLRYCTSLVKLDMRDNLISSIDELRDLKNLVWLDLGNNMITDISAIAGLYNLEYLDISGKDNDVKDWAPLVANVQAGGLGGGSTVVLSPEWTVKSDGSYYEDFEPVYKVLVDAGVRVVFATESQ